MFRSMRLCVGQLPVSRLAGERQEMVVGSLIGALIVFIALLVWWVFEHRKAGKP
jgi:hypothetical protein